MDEYHNDIREHNVITKNLIKPNAENSPSNENNMQNEPHQTWSLWSLLNHIIQLLFGNFDRKIAVKPGREPSVDFTKIFTETDNYIIENNFTESTNPHLAKLTKNKN